MKLHLRRDRKPRRHAQRPDAVLGFAGGQSTSLDELLGEVGAPVRPALPMRPEYEAWLRQQYAATLAQAGECHAEAARQLDAEKAYRDLAAGMAEQLHHNHPSVFDGPDADGQPIQWTTLYCGPPVLPTDDEDVPLYPHFTANPGDTLTDLAAVDGAAYGSTVIGGAR